jgi:two-component system sensor histidine kinase YesM
MRRVLRGILSNIFKVHYNTKLKYKLMLAYSIVFTVNILIVGFTSYYNSREYMTDSEKNAAKQSMVQLHNAIDSFLEIYYNKSEIAVNNIQLQKHLSTVQRDIVDLVYTYKDINDIIKQIISEVQQPYLKNSYYFGGNIQMLLYPRNESFFYDGETVFSYDEIKNEAWNEEMIKNDTHFNWESKVIYKNLNYISINRRLIDFESMGELGVLRLLIPGERIQNIIKKSIENSDYQLLYLDKAGNVVTSYGSTITRDNEFQKQVIEYASTNRGVSEMVIDGKNYVSGVMASEMTGWKLIYVTPMDNITKRVNQITYLVIVSILVSIVLCILIALFISSFMTRRIDILVRKTNMAEEGNLIVKSVIRGNDEIGQLDKNFNRMVKQIHQLIEVEYKSKILLNHTKFELLQEQINPHLHYNTLAMIASLAKKSNQTEIYEVTKHLIDFYKGMLNKGRIISSLSAEMEMIRHYIEITKFVYSLDIEVIFEVEEDILHYYSIKLLLQPLVENAILHGIMPLKKGTIMICGRELADGIELSVSDDGTGMPEHMMSYIRNLSDHKETEKGYGLTNVIRRFHLFFGESYKIQCESAPGMGTTFVVKIPKFTEEQIKEFLQQKYLY